MAKNLELFQEQIERGVELPELIKTDIGTLRLQDTLSKALPPVSNIGSNPLSGYSTKALDAARYAQEVGLAFGESKARLALGKAKSKADEKATEKYFKQLSRDNKKRLRAYSRGYVKQNNSFTRRFAGEMLGMGRDLFKVLA